MTTETLIPTATAPATLQNCYYLGDYERNGYGDSDFFVTYWDDNARRIETKEHSSTRYGGGWNWNAELIREIPAEVVQRLRAYMYQTALEANTSYEKRRVEEPTPESLGFGVRVRFLKDSDKRSKSTWQAGQVGECFWQGWYGTFYKNGYKTRGRSNGRLGVRMPDGSKVFCPMTAVRLDCEPDMEKVENAARGVAEGDQVRCPGAWWTNVASLGKAQPSTPAAILCVCS